jgi:hypothetical protein
MSRESEIKAQIAELQAELIKLQGSAFNDIIKTVAESKTLAAASEKLDMKKGKLEDYLIERGVPHLYGESWLLSCRRYLKGEMPVDNYTYPAGWKEKLPMIINSIEKVGFMPTQKSALKGCIARGEVPETTKTIQNVLGRYLQKHGYNTKGEHIGVPEWMS